jgi:cell division protein FtsI (penicillin-binding protein 3)
VIVAVVIDEPSNGAHYGGEVAAPIFSSVVGGTLRSLNVAPDSHVKQLVITDAVPESVQ